MLIVAKQPDLVRALSLVSRAAQKKGVMPILQAVHIDADSDPARVKVTCQDLEIFLQTVLPCEVKKLGEVLVPVELLLTLARSISQDAFVHLELTKNKLYVSGGTVSAKVNTFDVGQFPLPSLLTDHEIKLSALTVRYGLRRVAFVVDQQAASPQYRALGLIVDEQIAFCGINYTGFAEYQLFDEKNTTIPHTNVLIPMHAVAALGQILADNKQDAEITIGWREQKAVVVRLGDTVLLSQLVEGRLPNYRAAVPDNPKTRIVLSANELRASCQALDPFVQESAYTASLRTNGESITLEGKSKSIGDIVLAVEAKIEGEPQDLLVDSSRIEAALSVIGDTEVEIEVASPKHPIVLRETHDPDWTFVVALMTRRQAA